MKHICIYSETAHAVEFEKTIADDATVKDEVKIAKGDEHLADIPLVDYEKDRYAGECRCRGGDWKVYCEDKPFAWPEKAEEKTE